MERPATQSRKEATVAGRGVADRWEGGTGRPRVLGSQNPLRSITWAYHSAEALGVRFCVVKFTCTMPKRLA